MKPDMQKQAKKDKAKKYSAKKLAALLLARCRPEAQLTSCRISLLLVRFLLNCGCFKSTFGTSVTRGSPPAKVAMRLPFTSVLPCLTKDLWAGSYQWATLPEVEVVVGKGTGSTFELEDAWGKMSSSLEAALAIEESSPETLENEPAL